MIVSASEADCLAVLSANNEDKVLDISLQLFPLAHTITWPIPIVIEYACTINYTFSVWRSINTFYLSQTRPVSCGVKRARVRATAGCITASLWDICWTSPQPVSISTEHYFVWEIKKKEKEKEKKNRNERNEFFNCLAHVTHRPYRFRFRNDRYVIRRGCLVLCEGREDFRRGDRAEGHSRGARRDTLKNNYWHRVSPLSLSFSRPFGRALREKRASIEDHREEQEEERRRERWTRDEQEPTNKDFTSTLSIPLDI